MKKFIAKFRKLTVCVLALAMMMTLAGAVYADEADAYSEPSGLDYVQADAESTDIVGCLTIVSKFHENCDFTDGHSYLVFTSYLDDLTLDFRGIYGYYTFGTDFNSEVKEDYTKLSWKASVEELAPTYAPEAAVEDIIALGGEKIGGRYPALKNAMNDYLNTHCFAETFGEEQADARYRKVDCDYLMNKGDFISIGNYCFTDGDSTKLVKEAIKNCSAIDNLLQILKNNLLQGHTAEEIIDCLVQYTAGYLNGQYSTSEVTQAIKNYLKTVITQTGIEAVSSIASDPSTLIDGDAAGGILVSRELYWQKQFQDQSPNETYSVDITAAQLNDLLAYVNGGASHYSVAVHNCSTVSSAGWNEAVGYVRDANGVNTSEKSDLYIDSFDAPYGISGIINTPRVIYYTIKSWAGQDKGGTEASMDIVHGAEVPKDPDPEPETETTTQPESESATETTTQSESESSTEGESETETATEPEGESETETATELGSEPATKSGSGTGSDGGQQTGEPVPTGDTAPFAACMIAVIVLGMLILVAASFRKAKGGRKG